MNVKAEITEDAISNAQILSVVFYAHVTLLDSYWTQTRERATVVLILCLWNTK